MRRKQQDLVGKTKLFFKKKMPRLRKFLIFLKLCVVLFVIERVFTLSFRFFHKESNDEKIYKLETSSNLEPFSKSSLINTFLEITTPFNDLSLNNKLLDKIKNNFDASMEGKQSSTVADSQARNQKRNPIDKNATFTTQQPKKKKGIHTESEIKAIALKAQLIAKKFANSDQIENTSKQEFLRNSSSHVLEDITAINRTVIHINKQDLQEHREETTSRANNVKKNFDLKNINRTQLQESEINSSTTSSSLNRTLFSSDKNISSNKNVIHSIAKMMFLEKSDTDKVARDKNKDDRFPAMSVENSTISYNNVTVSAIDASTTFQGSTIYFNIAKNVSDLSLNQSQSLDNYSTTEFTTKTFNINETTETSLLNKTSRAENAHTNNSEKKLQVANSVERTVNKTHLSSTSVNKNSVNGTAIQNEEILLYSNEERKQTKRATGTSEKIWISMSICWSENTVLHNKGHYPYSFALKLSVKLWHLRTNHSLIIFIIHKPGEERGKDLANYVHELTDNGAHVELVLNSENISCPTQSQTERLLAFRCPLIADNDIIVTSDADAFVKDPDIFQPLTLKKYQYWIFQYDFSLKSGSTFPLCFIAMRKHRWKELIGVESAIELRQKYNHLYKEKGYNWYFDQTVITFILLKNHHCTLPKKHNLWKDLHLDVPENDIDDPMCFHGEHYANCHKLRPWVNGGCKYWHFLPSEREKDLQHRFDVIMADKS